VHRRVKGQAPQALHRQVHRVAAAVAAAAAAEATGTKP
jgi:hypothetical protein